MKVDRFGFCKSLTLGMGGAEAWIMELLRFWSRTGACSIDFLATSGNPGISDEEGRTLGATIYYLHYSRDHLSRFAKEFRHILRQGQYDLIHDHRLRQRLAFPYRGCCSPRVTQVHNPSYQILNNYGVTLSCRLTAHVGKKLIERYATYIPGTSSQVISDDYGFQQPTAGEATWAVDLLDLIVQARELKKANQQVAESAFSIQQSACAPTRLHSQGALA